MSRRTIKSILSGQGKFFPVLTAVLILGGLCIISLLFIDPIVFAWQREYLIHFDKPLLMKGFIQLGKAWLLIWLLFCWAFYTNCRRGAMVGLLALCLLAGTVLPVKMVTHRPRPREAIKNPAGEENHFDVFHSWSFPSGDTASAFAVAAAVLPFLKNRLTGFLVFLSAGWVGFFKVITLSHYLSDVFAGAALGILIGYTAYWLVVLRPHLRRDFLKLLNPGILRTGIIMIPVVTGAFNEITDVLIFFVFYPPLVMSLVLLEKARRSYP